MITAIELTHYLLTVRKDIIKVFGTSRPFASPNSEHPETDKIHRPILYLHETKGVGLVWANRSGVIRVISTVGLILHPHVSEIELAEKTEEWRFNPHLIFAFRALGHYMRKTFINVDNIGSHHVITRCAELVLYSMSTVETSIKIRSKQKIPKQILELEKRMAILVDPDRVKVCPALPYTGRYSFLHKVFTQISKRVVGTCMNNLITYRFQQSSDERHLHRNVEPDVNYGRRVATMDLLLNGVTEVDVDDLLILLERVINRLDTSEKYASISQLVNATGGNVTDSELIHLATSLYEIGRSWLRTKLIEVNCPYCTCHVKCTGQTGLYPKLESAFYEKSAPLHLSTVVCGGCRLSPTIENTTAKKPRRSVNSRNPKLTICVLDNLSTFKHVPLYALRVVNKNTIMYSHRFYATNSMNIMQEIFGQTPSAPGSRIYGVCYSGRRTCFKRFVDTLPSSRNSAGKLPYSQAHMWFRCADCKDLPIYDPSNYNYVPWSGVQHEYTCLLVVAKQAREHFRRVRNWDKAVSMSANVMCRGCRSAALCRHAVDGLLEIYIKSGGNETFLAKLSFIIALQKWIYIHGVCNPHNDGDIT